jgi:hypothetical protein
VNLAPRDRRALAILAVALILIFGYYFWPEDAAPTAPARVESVNEAQKRLARLRETAAGIPAKEALLKTVSAELAAREKGLVQAETAPQAQAQLIQMVRRLAMAETPPIEIRSTELGAVAPFGDVYGSVSVSMQMECRIEQLVNLLAAVATQPELVGPSDLRITSSSPKEKTIGARLTVTALVARRLVPERRGAAL